jgi:DNA-directed RNA polymerase subunit RPC12/RpoP
MGLFKRLSGQPANTPANPGNPGNPALVRAAVRWQPQAQPQVRDLPAQLRAQLQHAQASVFAYSDMVKQVDCARCGAPKQLPTKTAYVYCDHCGALTDYDFRVANLDTNAALTNQVFAYYVVPIQPTLDICAATGDKERYTGLIRPVFTEWFRQCPQAHSPRLMSDQDFFERTVNYQVEAMWARDSDQRVQAVMRQFNAASQKLRRIPLPNGDWQISDDIWDVAALYKQQMELSYQVLTEKGIMALEPEQAPVSVWLRIEYTYFCQNWLAKIPPQNADRFLEFFGLRGEYTQMKVVNAETKQCGRCGDQLHAVPGAQAIVCESCGTTLDIAGGAVPCQNCGAPLSFPVRTSSTRCPYCHVQTHRA